MIQRRAEFGKVVVDEFRIQQADADAVLNKFWKIFAVLGRHIGLRRVFFKDLVADRVKQQACGDEAVCGVFFDVLASREHYALAYFFR